MTKQTHAVTSSMTKKKSADPRKGIRFSPDPGTIAQIDLSSRGKAFAPSLTGLVTEESYRGCGIVVAMTKKLQVGDRVRVKVGRGPALAAEIRWRTDLDSQVARIGIMFME